MLSCSSRERLVSTGLSGRTDRKDCTSTDLLRNRYLRSHPARRDVYKRQGWETIIVNNNPETVSTDFDIADKLYFEPLTAEDVESLSLIHI